MVDILHSRNVEATVFEDGLIMLLEEILIDCDYLLYFMLVLLTF